jgi:molecular chaperone HtpG
MSFYGQMPDSYSLVLNTAHPAIQALVDKTEGQEEQMKQLIDIALLAAGQLKGEALAKFVNRSVALLNS